MPHSPEPHDSRMTRRDFSRRAVSTAAGLLVGSSLSSAEEPKPAPAAGEAAMSPILTQIRSVCPALTEADQKELETQVKGVLDLAKTLRSLKVHDGAEPDFVFRANREATHAR